jgi:pimeloyl-ACP methyl ester carboxylesterase
MKKCLIVLILTISYCSLAQESKLISTNISINKHIDGTLLELPDSNLNTIAILIAGSGPTDRDGNQNFLKNNSLKSLAIALANRGISTFRYDKRIVKQLLSNNIDKNIMFDDFVTDAVSVLGYFKNQNRYKNLVIIGHSQGSLVGMLAAQQGATGFVSLAGAGQEISEVITEQITKTAPMFKEDTKRVFDIMKTGQTTTEYPPALFSIFNPEIQPFIMNWMQYNPAEEIKKLEIPILIINGTKDLQVSVEEAQLLKDAAPNSQLTIIENMNHVLFTIEGDDLENSKSYNEPYRKVDQTLIDTVTIFINNLSK